MDTKTAEEQHCLSVEMEEQIIQALMLVLNEEGKHTLRKIVEVIEIREAPLKKRIEELEVELRHCKFKMHNTDPEVQEWLRSVDEASYDRCKAIQNNFPALRALGTKGAMIVCQILNPSTNGKQD
ncbi:MAG: hypothetical protein QOA70_06785 [Nitrososphaeraceae archaeon]|nr:hypothetical protein [Nitrososphaeraceae archaeon]